MLCLPHFTSRCVLLSCVSVLFTYLSLCGEESRQPNIVIIVADDMGYGDMSCNGHPTIRTPHLDRMASGGQKWTNFYAAASVCTPSRAGLLTGRYPIRNGMCSSVYQVLFPDSTGGLPANEITIAELLRDVGYRTAMVGKWHLGHLPEYLPIQHGFDSWFGIPYSNDMDMDRDTVKELNGGSLGEWHTGQHWNEPKSEYWRVPLMAGGQVLERGPDQRQLTQIYTQKSVEFIKENAGQPFFLYLAHSMPHVPLFRSKEFLGSSTAGIYGDVIEELDWSVGEVLKALQACGIDEDTLVLFTSDNGPWLQFKTQGGSAGPLRGGKGTTWDGGMRVPAIFWWPGTIEAAVIHGIGSTLDLMATIASVVDVELPLCAEDSFDLTETLFNGGLSSRDDMIFYRHQTIEAIRRGRFKGHFDRTASNRGEIQLCALYDLNEDPAERYDLAGMYPEQVSALTELYRTHRAGIVPAVDQLARR